jgi:NAD(P)-dependent dehydrogenase (short-subunit alcohol dehydrogenase family)
MTRRAWLIFQVVNVPQPQTPYNFSKAAVRHMARSLAVEWAHNKIRVNCISPGYVLTNLTKGMRSFHLIVPAVRC